jgi:ubiquinone/menaquinone biosynthesis C-methylase UbiE
LEIHGCDISDLLIRRAIQRGIPTERLRVCDAAAMDYPDGSFDYGYSIGSLEHFDEPGLLKCIRECHRVIKSESFHTVPVSRSGRDEGWLRSHQSFHNNSVEWWVRRLRTSYRLVRVLDSRWQDDWSVGKWFVCVK